MPRGGYRPGSGPKKGTKYKPRALKDGQKPIKSDIPVNIAKLAEEAGLMPLDYMLNVMRDAQADTERRDRMAQIAAPFCHARKGEGNGKKQEREDKAKTAGAGKFAQGAPPLKRVK